MKASKKLLNKYDRDLNGSRVKNTRFDDERLIECKIYDMKGFDVLEKYLNENEFEFRLYDGSFEEMDTHIEFILQINEIDLKTFNELWKDFKSQYESLKIYYIEEKNQDIKEIEKLMNITNQYIRCEGDNKIKHINNYCVFNPSCERCCSSLNIYETIDTIYGMKALLHTGFVTGTHYIYYKIYHNNSIVEIINKNNINHKPIQVYYQNSIVSELKAYTIYDAISHIQKSEWFKSQTESNVDKIVYKSLIFTDGYLNYKVFMSVYKIVNIEVLDL